MAPDRTRVVRAVDGVRFLDIQLVGDTGWIGGESSNSVISMRDTGSSATKFYAKPTHQSREAATEPSVLVRFINETPYAQFGKHVWIHYFRIVLEDRQSGQILAERRAYFSPQWGGCSSTSALLPLAAWHTENRSWIRSVVKPVSVGIREFKLLKDWRAMVSAGGFSLDAKVEPLAAQVDAPVAPQQAVACGESPPGSHDAAKTAVICARSRAALSSDGGTPVVHTTPSQSPPRAWVDAAPRGIFVTHDGSKLYLLDPTTETHFEYSGLSLVGFWTDGIGDLWVASFITQSVHTQNPAVVFDRFDADRNHVQRSKVGVRLAPDPALRQVAFFPMSNKSNAARDGDQVRLDIPVQLRGGDSAILRTEFSLSQLRAVE